MADASGRRRHGAGLRLPGGPAVLTVKGEEMTGMVYGIMPATMSLKRQR